MHLFKHPASHRVARAEVEWSVHAIAGVQIPQHAAHLGPEGALREQHAGEEGAELLTEACLVGGDGCAADGEEARGDKRVLRARGRDGRKRAAQRDAAKEDDATEEAQGAGDGRQEGLHEGGGRRGRVLGGADGREGRAVDVVRGILRQEGDGVGAVDRRVRDFRGGPRRGDNRQQHEERHRREVLQRHCRQCQPATQPEI